MKMTWMSLAVMAGTLALSGSARADGTAEEKIPSNAYIDEAYFDFNPDTQGWTFGSPGGFFAPPINSYQSSSLRMKSVTNTSTFGYWDSEEFFIYSALKSEEKDRGIILPPPITFPTYYFASETLTSDLYDPLLMPQFRFRVANGDYSYTSVMTVSSYGDAAYTINPIFLQVKGFPTPYGMYYHFFEMPPDSEGLRKSFDMLNVDGVDSETAELRLLSDRTMLDNFPSGTATELLDLDFTMSQHGFSQVSLPGVAAPDFSFDTRGLGLSGKSESVPPLWRFGYWTETSDVTFENNSIYRVSFTIWSDEPTATEVPTFRVRVNDSSLQGSWYLNIDSTGSDPYVPTNAQERTYTVWIISSSALEGKKMIFNVDYLWLNGDGNDAESGLFVRHLNVKKYPFFLL